MDSDEETIAVRRSKRRRSSITGTKRKSVDDRTPNTRRKRRNTRTPQLSPQETQQENAAMVSETTAATTVQVHRTYGNIRQSSNGSSLPSRDTHVAPLPVQRNTTPIRMTRHTRQQHQPSGHPTDSPAKGVGSFQKLNREESQRVRSAANRIQTNWRQRRGSADLSDNGIEALQDVVPQVMQTIETNSDESPSPHTEEINVNNREIRGPKDNQTQVLSNVLIEPNLCPDHVASTNTFVGLRRWSRGLLLLVATILVILVHSTPSQYTNKNSTEIQRDILTKLVVRELESNTLQDQAHGALNEMSASLSKLQKSFATLKSSLEIPKPAQGIETCWAVEQGVTDPVVQSCVLDASNDQLNTVLSQGFGVLKQVTEVEQLVRGNVQSLKDIVNEQQMVALTTETGLQNLSNELSSTVAELQSALKSEMKSSSFGVVDVEIAEETFYRQTTNIQALLDLLSEKSYAMFELIRIDVENERDINVDAEITQLEAVLHNLLHVSGRSTIQTKSDIINQVTDNYVSLQEMEKYVQHRVFQALGDDSGIRDLSITGAGAHIYFEDKLIPREPVEKRKRKGIVEQLISQARFVMSSVWSMTAENGIAATHEPTYENGVKTRRVHRGKPDMIFTPTRPTRNCWAMPQVQGNITVELPRSFNLTGFAIEHGFEELSPLHPPSVAPKFVQLYGIKSVDCGSGRDINPLNTQAVGNQHGEGHEPNSGIADWFGRLGGGLLVHRTEPICYQEWLLGEMWYNNSTKSDRVQTTRLKPQVGAENISVVKFVVQENHGHPGYTCIHRLRVF